MDKKCYICDNEAWEIKLDLFFAISKISNKNLMMKISKALKQTDYFSNYSLLVSDLIGKSKDEIIRKHNHPLRSYYRKIKIMSFDDWDGSGTGYLGDICSSCRADPTFRFIAKRRKSSLKKLLGFGYPVWYYYDTRAIEQNKLKIKESVIKEWKNNMDLFNSALKLETAKIAKSKAEKEKLENDIVTLLKNKAIKMPLSDINALLKFGDLDMVKKTCEEMYENGKIDFAGNGRYYIQTAQEEKKKKSTSNKSEPVDVKSELKKYKEMLDDGLIEQEDYDAKKKELLGL